MISFLTPTLEERLVLGAQSGVFLVAPDATDRVVQPVRRGRGALRLQKDQKNKPVRFKIRMRKQCSTKTRQGKARQDKTRQDKARQEKTRQGKARQDKTRQDKTRQDKTRQGKTRQDRISTKTGSGQTPPSKVARTERGEQQPFCVVLFVPARSASWRGRGRVDTSPAAPCGSSLAPCSCWGDSR
eukprot:COSAG06_NODE_6061_length_3129_cov_3.646321_2_plen_185_part_00